MEQHDTRLREERQRKDLPAAGHDGHAVVASTTRDVVGVVEEAVDASVVELLGRLGEEEVTKEPTILAQDLKRRH